MKKIVSTGTIICLIFLFVLLFFIGFHNMRIKVYAEDEEFTSILMITILTHGLGGGPKDWSNTEFIIRVNE